MCVGCVMYLLWANSCLNVLSPVRDWEGGKEGGIGEGMKEGLGREGRRDWGEKEGEIEEGRRDWEVLQGGFEGREGFELSFVHVFLNENCEFILEL